jgi:HK97 family phage portal protein
MKLFGYELTLKRLGALSKKSMGKVSGMISPFALQFKTIPHDDYFSQVMAYKSWVYICAKKNAEAVAAVPLRLYVIKKTKETKFTSISTKEVSKETKKYLSEHAGTSRIIQKGVDFEEVTEHVFLDLLQKVNPFNNRFDLWENTETFLELTGNAYWYLVKNKAGVPEHIWVIPSQFMRIVPDKEKFIAGYVYQCGTIKIPFDEEEIIHFKFASPLSQYYGYSPIAAIDVAYSLNELTGEYEKSLLEHQGRPEGVIYSEDIEMSVEDFDKLKKEFRDTYTGAENVGKTMLLQGGLKYQSVSLSPKDMTTIQIREMSREEIAAAYGMPMSKLTTEDVNRSNSEIGEIQHKRDTIVPRLKRLEEKINERLTPIYDDKLFVAFDNPVPEDKEFKLKERETNLKHFYSSVNLERLKDGEKPVDWGEIPLGQMGIMPISTENYPAPGSDKPQQPQGPKPNEGEALVDMVESIAYRVKERVDRILDVWQKTLDKDDNKDE